MSKDIKLPFGIGFLKLGPLFVYYINIRLRYDEIATDEFVQPCLSLRYPVEANGKGYVRLVMVSTKPLNKESYYVGNMLKNVAQGRLNRKYGWVMDAEQLVNEQEAPYTEIDL